jgi:octaprenyl-diphosphate synthase
MPVSGAKPEMPAARPQDPVERLIAILSTDIHAVDQLIHERLSSPVSMIPNVATYLIDAGGKRIRPLITLAAASLFGPVNDAARRLAAAVEFIHTATLLHDDVVDGSDLRRGKAAANAVWGNSASVLVGDFLFSRAFALMVEAGDMATLDVLSRTSGVIAEGEVMQLAAVNDVDVPLERYLQIIEAKTAALFSAAARVGAMAAGQSGAQADALAGFGRALGMAFQLIDDALDYGGATSSLGKNIGDDFREGKLTLPVVLAREQANAQEEAFWRRVMGGGVQQAGDFEQALALFQLHGAMARTLATAREYADRARDSLQHAPPGPVRSALADLAEFVLERAH